MSRFILMFFRGKLLDFNTILLSMRGEDKGKRSALETDENLMKLYPQVERYY